MSIRPVLAPSRPAITELSPSINNVRKNIEDQSQAGTIWDKAVSVSTPKLSSETTMDNGKLITLFSTFYFEGFFISGMFQDFRKYL